MASTNSTLAMSFSDFPEDVQIKILSFLSPFEVSAFACTSRRFAALCGAAAPNSPLWLAVCERRWGSLTRPRSWVSSSVSFARVYKALDRWEHLIGFWRRIGHGGTGTPHLIFFEWGPSYIAGSWVSPAPDASGGDYGVLKMPFLWLGLSQYGEPISFLHTGARFDPSTVFLGSVLDSSSSSSGFADPDMVPVSVSFMGCSHLVVEENRTYRADSREDYSIGVLEEIEAAPSPPSPPDRMMLEIHQYLADRTSPGGDKLMRRLRKKERERFGGWLLWEAEHFLKINNYYPTPERPLQGLWKGFSENMILEFYLVSYDDIGGITCRRVREAKEQFSGHSPVFWTSNTTFLEPPFPSEEQDLYANREHIRPANTDRRNNVGGVISRILCINSSYDLVIPGLSDFSGDPRNAVIDERKKKEKETSLSPKKAYTARMNKTHRLLGAFGVSKLVGEERGDFAAGSNKKPRRPKKRCPRARTLELLRSPEEQPCKKPCLRRTSATRSDHFALFTDLKNSKSVPSP